MNVSSLFTCPHFKCDYVMLSSDIGAIISINHCHMPYTCYNFIMYPIHTNKKDKNVKLTFSKGSLQKKTAYFMTSGKLGF